MSTVLHQPASPAVPDTRPGEPTWEIARLFPEQEAWTEAAYFNLPTNRLVEFRDGTIEVLEMAGIKHLRFVSFLFARLLEHLGERSRWAIFSAPLPLRVAAHAYREPDLMVVEDDHVEDSKPALEKASLVIEIICPSERGRKRDLVEKRVDYESAGIPQYWIVDPEERTITVLALDGAAYREAGVYCPGDQAASVLLEGLAIDVTACFAAGELGVDEQEPAP